MPTTRPTGLPSSMGLNEAIPTSSQPAQYIDQCSPNAIPPPTARYIPTISVPSGAVQMSQASPRPTQSAEVSGPRLPESSLVGHSVRVSRLTRTSRTVSAAPSVEVAQRRIERDGGLTPECSAKYIDLLRSFLTAKICKTEFEREIDEILKTSTARRTHNGIIIDLLRSSMMRHNPQLPRLSAVLPGSLRSKNQVHKPPASKFPTSNRVPSKAPVAPQPSLTKRPRVDPPKVSAIFSNSRNNAANAVSETNLNSVSVAGTLSKTKENPDHPISSTLPQTPTVQPTTLHDSTSLGKDPQTDLQVNPAIQPGVVQRSARSHRPYYVGLSMAPGVSISTIDADLFRRLRQRVHHLTIHTFAMAAPHDDAVALLLHGIEIHVKMLLQATVNTRLNHVPFPEEVQFVPYPLISSHHMLQVARHNTKLLGDEAGVERERLLLMP